MTPPADTSAPRPPRVRFPAPHSLPPHQNAVSALTRFFITNLSPTTSDARKQRGEAYSGLKRHLENRHPTLKLPDEASLACYLFDRWRTLDYEQITQTMETVELFSPEWNALRKLSRLYVPGRRNSRFHYEKNRLVWRIASLGILIPEVTQ